MAAVLFCTKRCQWNTVFCPCTFSPMDTPPEVMMTSARLMPSFRALSRSSGLWGSKKHTGVSHQLRKQQEGKRKHRARKVYEDDKHRIRRATCRRTCLPRCPGWWWGNRAPEWWPAGWSDCCPWSSQGGGHLLGSAAKITDKQKFNLQPSSVQV